MVWLKSLVCFLGWIGTGYWVWRKWGSALVERPVHWSWAPVSMLGGGVLMVGGMALVGVLGGVVKGEITVLGWVGALVLGAVFTGLQTFGAMVAISRLPRGETEPAQGASEQPENRP